MGDTYTGQIYCVRCRAKREVVADLVVSINGRRMAKAICPECGTRLNLILGKAPVVLSDTVREAPPLKHEVREDPAPSRGAPRFSCHCGALSSVLEFMSYSDEPQNVVDDRIRSEVDTHVRRSRRLQPHHFLVSAEGAVRCACGEPADGEVEMAEHMRDVYKARQHARGMRKVPGGAPGLGKRA